jgi:hypothetical protein
MVAYRLYVANAIDFGTWQPTAHLPALEVESAECDRRREPARHVYRDLAGIVLKRLAAAAFSGARGCAAWEAPWTYSATVMRMSSWLHSSARSLGSTSISADSAGILFLMVSETLSGECFCSWASRAS